jgi:hypothetical protein
VGIDSVLEEALAEVTLGTGSIAELAGICTDAATELLEGMSIAKVEITANKLVRSVASLRSLVDSRYKGTVVSPRTTIHAAAMVRAGFTLNEALASKLPGLKETEISDLIAAIRL